MAAHPAAHARPHTRAHTHAMYTTSVEGYGPAGLLVKVHVHGVWSQPKHPLQVPQHRHKGRRRPVCVARVECGFGVSARCSAFREVISSTAVEKLR